LALSVEEDLPWRVFELRVHYRSEGEHMSDDLKGRVQELIDTMINPAVAGHGGFVELIDVQDNRVYLQMGGGCQGCGAADITLKSGIERLIKKRSPRWPRCSTPPTTRPAATLLLRG